MRAISPLNVNFKWTPFSVKSDFYKIPSLNNQNVDIRLQDMHAKTKNMINHLEGHRELTTKDNLVINLKG